MRILCLVTVVLIIAASCSGQAVSASDIAALKSKAEAGDVSAQVKLGHAYETGNGVAKSFVEAMKWYRSAADKGNAEAQNNLGVMYRTGNGVERDKAEAVKWYARAAEQGFAPAMYNLGVAYYNGDGVAADEIQAYAYFMLAARAGSAEAATAADRSETELGPRRVAQGKLLAVRMLSTGAGVPADGAAGIQILRTLDANADPAAVLKMATAVREGRGFPRESSVAYKLCELAATGDNTGALICLAEMNENGEGVQKSGAVAAQHYLKAVRAGSDEAAIRLAQMYTEGAGVAQDRTTAYLLLKWAAVDSERAKSKWAELRATMKDQEIKIAEQKWATWRP